MIEFLLTNWAELTLAVLALLKVIVNLTPSAADNKVFSYLDAIFDAIITNHTNEKE